MGGNYLREVDFFKSEDLDRPVYLNAVVIKNRLTEQSLRQWWVAEQLGVDRRTVSRWLNGTVRKTDSDTAAALAKILGATVEDITVDNEEDLFATSDDQRQAAEILSTTQLVDKLGPVGEWDVLEKLLKATLIPNLPKAVLGEMYNQLAVSSWRQNKIDEARRYAVKAKEVGDSTGDKSVLAHALLNLANIFSWDGKPHRALDTYRECVGLKPFLGDRKTGSALNNMSAVSWEIGDLTTAIDSIDGALRCFEADGQAMNFSIAHAQKAAILLEMEDKSGSKDQIDLSIAHGVNGNYLPGVGFGQLLLAHWQALYGSVDEVQGLVRDGLEHQSDQAIMVHLNYEVAARAFRIAKLYDDAGEMVAIGLKLKTDHDFPISVAALHKEAGLIQKSLGSLEGARDHLTVSLNLYRQCGAGIRVRELEAILDKVDALYSS